MSKAWEIARQGQKKFGGQIKEYFSQALRMAWGIVKKSMDRVDKIGFIQMKDNDGYKFFAVKDVEGIQVNLLSEKSGINGKYTHRKSIVNSCHFGNHKQTGEPLRIYWYAHGCGDIEIIVEDQRHVISNTTDLKKWGIRKW